MYTVQTSMFEALFVRALRVAPGGDFAQELEAAGYLLGEARLHYDIATWVACLDVAARRLYAGEERFEAWRRLGRIFIEGYFETVIGRAIAAVLPFMSPERFLDRMPHFVRTGLGGSTTDVDRPRPGVAEVLLHGPHEGAAYVLAGVLEGCFERLQVTAQLAPRALGGVASRIDLTWTPA